MIKAYTPLNNLEYTVYKPIVASLVKHFSTKILKNPDIFVEYSRDSEIFGESMYDTNYSNQYKKQWLVVDYQINHDESTMLTNNIRGNDGINLLVDKDIDYYIRSIPLTHNFTVTIKIFDKFKNRLLRLLNAFKLGEINDTNYLILDADVFFTIPTNVIALTKNIVKLKYGDENLWYKYIESFSTLPLDKLVSKSGKKYTLVYRGEYRDVAVWTEVGFLDKEVEREDNAFSLELTLKFSFDVITSLEVVYPILICNKPINKEYLLISDTLLKKYALPIERSVFDSSKINTIVNYLGVKLRNDTIKILERAELEPYIKLVEESPELQDYGNDINEIILNSVDKFIDDMYNLNYHLKRVNPIYDVWRNYINYDGYEACNTLLLKIEPKSYVYMNLYELTNLGYSKEFVDYLIDNKEKFLTLYKGFFHFNIYANKELIPMKELDIVEEDTYIEELDLTLKRGDIYNVLAVENNKTSDEKLYLDLLKYYHMVIYILHDPQFIPDYENEEITLLLQYLAMNRLDKLEDFSIETPMKTVMEFSLLAYNTNGKPPVINQLLKDSLKG